MLERTISKDDYVVSYNNVYQVTELRGNAYLRILLVDKSKTTKSKIIHSKDVCVIDMEDVLIWKIKREY